MGSIITRHIIFDAEEWQPVYYVNVMVEPLL